MKEFCSKISLCRRRMIIVYEDDIWCSLLSFYDKNFKGDWNCDRKCLFLLLEYIYVENIFTSTRHLDILIFSLWKENNFRNVRNKDQEWQFGICHAMVFSLTTLTISWQSQLYKMENNSKEQDSFTFNHVNCQPFEIFNMTCYLLL